jgi:hypothetical protein
LNNIDSDHIILSYILYILSLFYVQEIVKTLIVKRDAHGRYLFVEFGDVPRVKLGKLCEYVDVTLDVFWDGVFGKFFGPGSVDVGVEVAAVSGLVRREEENKVRACWRESRDYRSFDFVYNFGLIFCNWFGEFHVFLGEARD